MINSYLTPYKISLSKVNEIKRMVKKWTIKKIADELNLSITTVSFILNGKGEEKRISKKVIDDVLHFISEVGYSPSTVARNLRIGKSKTIAFIAEDISGSLFASIAKQIEDKFEEMGYTMIYASTENDATRAKNVIENLKNRQVDAFIVTPTNGIEKELEQLIAEKYPVVIFDRLVSGIDSFNVIIDNYNASFDGTKHLIDNGYKSIGFVTVDLDQSQIMDRMNGYIDCVTQNGLLQYILRVPYAISMEEKESLIKSFITEFKQLDSLLFASNHLAIPGLRVIKQMKLKIPTDIGVVTFDDRELYQLHEPTITAIDQPVALFAERIVKGISMQLLNETDNVDLDKNTLLPETLIVRESSSKK